MKLPLLVVLTLLATPGCGKTSDLVAMQDEANGMVTAYKPKFERLNKRVIALQERSKRLPPQVALDPSVKASLKDVQGLFQDAGKKLGEMSVYMSGTADSVQRTAAEQAAGENGERKNPRIELIKLMGAMETRLEHDYTEINTNLDTVESWLAMLEWRPQVVAQVAPTKPVPEPEPGAVPAPEPEPAPAPGPAVRPPPAGSGVH